MATVHRTVELSAAPEEAWAKIADVGGINQILPFLGEVTLEGDRRTCSLGGATLEELILSIDPDRRRLAYAIVGGPFGFTQHSASMQIITSADGCVLGWNHDFKPDDRADMLAEALAGAVAALHETSG
jgi:carbon monoxide dehydrogenase subunit G